MRLEDAIARHARLAVAVSGGVDSMTLAHVAHALTSVTVLHAVSPAVPRAATERVQRHAARSGWDLRLVDAAELADPRYRANPVDRCYFCKTNLYARIRKATDAPIASGTNTDDLGDFRPGLTAAAEHDVVHPFVEAELAKADVYALARSLGLDDLAVLPAQPCLASRIETGIAVTPDDLALIEAVEAALAPLLPVSTSLRCRITARGVVVETDSGLPDRVLEAAARAACETHGRQLVGMRPYRRGSAFLREPTA